MAAIYDPLSNLFIMLYLKSCRLTSKVHIWMFNYEIELSKQKRTSSKESCGLMDKVSVLQSWDHGFEPHKGDNHDSLYDTSTDFTINLK